MDVLPLATLLILIAVAFTRELIGRGSLMGYQIFEPLSGVDQHQNRIVRGALLYGDYPFHSA